MKQQTMLGILFFAGLLGILSLSSFYFNPSSHQPQDAPDNGTSGYNSNNKQSQSRDGISVATGFENDFYTNSFRDGYFYVEVNADNRHESIIEHIPLNISVVIDRSGSMAGEKMRNAKQAAKHIVDQLSSDDYLSVVIYDGSIDVLQSTVAVRNKEMIKRKIDGITDRGGTNLMGGAMKGYEEVKRYYKPGYVNRVLLLSDGQANEGITDPYQIEKIVRRQIHENGISISTFGLGNDYNEDLMTAMAEKGSGNYYFIDHAEKIAGIFSKELNGLLDIVAKQTTLTITIPEDVNIDRVYGFNHTQTGRQLSIQMHDLFANETKGVLIRYHVNRAINSTLNFATRLSYQPVSTREASVLSTRNRCEFTSSNNMYNEHYNEWVSAQVALYHSNEQLEIAMKEVDKGNYQQAKEIVKKNKEYMATKAPLVEKSVELKKAESANAVYEEKIVNVENMDVEDKKYLQKASKSSNYEIRTKKK